MELLQYFYTESLMSIQSYFFAWVQHMILLYTGVLLLWTGHGCFVTNVLLKHKIKHAPPHSCCFGAVGGNSVASWMCLIQTQRAIITPTFLCTPLTARMTHTTASHWWVNLHLYLHFIFAFTHLMKFKGALTPIRTSTTKSSGTFVTTEGFFRHIGKKIKSKKKNNLTL